MATFTRKWLRLSVSGPFGLIALVMAVGFTQPQPWGEYVFDAVMVVCSAFAAWRGNRMATIEVREEGVELRSFVRTRRFPWAEVTAFEAPEKANGTAGNSISVLTSRGETVNVDEFWSPTRKAKNGDAPRPNRCQQIVIELNEHLHRVREGDLDERRS